jgi:peptidoglycan-N-acetylglucosamine deacetylase
VSYAVFSCDLDTVDRHLQGYGFEDLPPCDVTYRHAVPRVLELLAELGVPGVLFVIARDAERERTLLAEAISAGHEVASHSLTHPQPFRTLDDAALHEELVTSRARLADVTGTEIAGFRAPAWDVDTRVLGKIAEAGYRYDASIFPTPALVASRLAAYRRSASKGSIFEMSVLRHAFARRGPHRIGENGSTLLEFPIAVTPWLRLPVYHTVSYLVPFTLFRRALDSLLRTSIPVCYEFHAADLLDLERDGTDARMSRHPGMREPLAERRARLAEVLRRIMAARRVTTYRRAIDDGDVC